MRHLIVECTTQDCPAAGTARRVALRLVALDVYEKPNLVCAKCGNAVAEVEQPAAELPAKED